MTVQIFGDLYTSGTGDNAKLVCYNLENLDLKRCLVRVNKVSENGIALTLAVTLSSDFESKVSKAASEKGVTAIKKSKGDIILIEVNSSIKDDRKPGEVNGRCSALANAFKGSMTKDGTIVSLGNEPTPDGSIILLTFDGGAIPSKGILKLNSFKSYLEDEDESILFITPFDELIPESGDQVINEFEALKGSKFVEKQAFQKGKTFDQVFEERLTYIEGVLKDPNAVILGRIVKIFGETMVTEENEDGTEVIDLAAMPSSRELVMSILSV